MATSRASGVTVCSICGEPLNAKGECLACLLRTGLDESVVETKPSASIVFGDFEIMRREDGSFWELGHGAMGVTYLAMDKVLHRRVALKVIEVPAVSNRRDSQVVRDRFLREARAAAALRHPNVAGVFQFGALPDASHCYYAMELVEGETLEARVQRDGPFKAEPALEIAIQVTRALIAAAARGLIHRDLKPANIMLAPDDSGSGELEVKVIDFGLAKAIAGAGGEMDLTHGGFVGTPNFASPEQFGSGPVDARSDIYSLGATLWFALTGLAPHSGSTIEEIRDRQTRDDLPVEQLVARNVPEPIIKLLRATLAVDLSKRPAFARELMEALESCRLKNAKNFFAELKRRNVYKVAIAYGVVAWLLMQVASQIFPFFEIPNWAVRLVIVLLLIGFPLALILGWAFDLTSQGVRATPRAAPGTHRHRNVIVLVAAGVIISATAGFFLLPRVSAHKVDKSVAVLPFENLSKDEENAFFADGVQDEILTDLARIADLKVIGRTSVVQYKSRVARNLREIGQQLGVAHVVEGSVQRSGNRVRVNAQLLDARTDRHLWGQTYDRDLGDVFAIQSEIAKTIAGQLQAKLSPAEKSAIERHPTSDITAFDLYMLAKNLLLTKANIASTGKADLLQAVELLNQAVAHDPSFFQAYCQLARTHDSLYSLGFDHTSARLGLAEAAVEAAARLHPDSGEAHLARAELLYRGYLDYDGAQAELEVAGHTLPNDPRIAELTGYIKRRQGRWEESTQNLERALDLDPRNVSTLQQIALSYELCRRYAEEKLVWDRIFAIVPNSAEVTAGRALAELYSKADTRPLHQVINSIQAGNPAALPRIAEFWLDCALSERDTDAAENALIALGESPINLGAPDNVRFKRTFAKSLIARMRGDGEKARLAFTAARMEQEKVVQAQPNYGPALCVLGLIDAGLGRKEEALREGHRAVELLPVEKDALGSITMVKYLAMIAGWVGDKDLACEQLAITIRRPSPVSYGQLKLLPFWDPLRGDPRFEKLVEESKKPVTLR